jgi:hypothetical protein
MPDPKLEDYAEGMRILLNAKEYVEKRKRRFDIDAGIATVLNRAMLDVADAMIALIKKGERNAGSHA